MATNINEIFTETLKLAIKNGASDVHFSSGMPPVLRIIGQLRQVDVEALENSELTELFHSMLNERQKKYFLEHNEIDFAVDLKGLSRFRINFFQHMKGISGAFRIVSNEIKTIQQLRLPVIIEKVLEKKKGLILVTGPTGSGKSTSLAAMINNININNRDHIITIEDPIEYVHKPAKSLIHQREIGIHAEDFPAALRSALREDPDVILVGEMRDTVTIENALRAAETGHLVFSTLHTNSAAETIDRIVNVFPAENQQQVKQLLASTLVAVISQRLIPKALENDRVALMEILVNTDAVKNLIREGKTHQIDSTIQTGVEHGMQSFERSLADLKQNNLISPQLELFEFV
ncbi:MAG: PilT/PilU family type 4a pilus ATPase [Calditrichaeota bacterium]|nr:MAG: PilT/PilU family type 4a pilus ATPase [Calditrichota bacterium]MBL1204359.1 PilT/PilU family type 4a pilus ATPase [Calditrichota bacterium]NOG44188.1 PilT/PilU family type 4a pilus ATPase [Calditrichota bacterium]